MSIVKHDELQVWCEVGKPVSRQGGTHLAGQHLICGSVGCDGKYRTPKMVKKRPAELWLLVNLAQVFALRQIELRAEVFHDFFAWLR